MSAKHGNGEDTNCTIYGDHYLLMLKVFLVKEQIIEHADDDVSLTRGSASSTYCSNTLL